MIIVLKQNAPDVQVHEFCRELEGMGLQINDSKGSDTHILGLIGDTKAIAESWVLANPVVEACRRVSEPYKKANRKFHPDDSIIDVNGVKIGGGNFAVIAGPCSIESEEQITYCAQRVKAAGASLLRGGAFKPRTSPYSFQGMRSEGLDLLKMARRPCLSRARPALCIPWNAVGEVWGLIPPARSPVAPAALTSWAPYLLFFSLYILQGPSMTAKF